MSERFYLSAVRKNGVVKYVVALRFFPVSICRVVHDA